MRAWLLKSFDGIKDLELVQNAPEPKPTAGEVILQMRYAALNPADRYLAEGQYPAHPPLPHIFGRDGVGSILGTGQMRMVLRGEVGVTRWGTLAERVAVPETDQLEIPVGWSLEESAGAALVYLTAFQALTQWSDLDLAGKNVLITGASGGVGIACIQLGKALRARIFAMSRNKEKSEQLRQLGADEILDPADDQLVAHVKKQLKQRIDLAVDNIGGPFFSQLLEVMNQNGRISCVGRLAGPVPQFNTASIFFRRLRIGGVAVGTYGREEAHVAWEKIVKLLAKTSSRPIVDSIWAMEDLPKAFARLHEGPMGKVLVRISK
jgi:NADPH2:quinone reductase